MAKPKLYVSLSHALFPYCNRKTELKGNRVKIPDSPAAVSFINELGNTIATDVITPITWEGVQIGSKSEDLQSKIVSDGLEERPEERTNELQVPIYSFYPFIRQQAHCIILFLIILP